MQYGVCIVAFVLRCNNIRGLRAFLALLHIEGHGLTDLQVLILPVAGAMMKENVVRSLDGNETEPLLGLGLDSSCLHTGRGEIVESVNEDDLLYAILGLQRHRSLHFFCTGSFATKTRMTIAVHRYTMAHFMSAKSTPLAAVRSSSVRRVVRHSLLANFLILSAILALQLSTLWREMPLLGAESFWLPETVVLTDSQGKEMRRLYLDKDRLELSDDAFPTSLKQAVIAIEDERFLSRSCIDVRALTRAAFANMMKYKSQGASTITQQLVGNLMLDRSEKSFARKSIEILLSCRLEHVVTRDRILGMYLNHMAFGGAIYGAEEASQTYFGVSAEHLTIAQSVVLAALLKAPTSFSPYGTRLHTALRSDVTVAIRKGSIRRPEDIPPDAITIGLIGTWFRGPNGSAPMYLDGRTDFVLQAMRQSGFINDAEQDDAKRELLAMQFLRRQSIISMPYFALYVQKQLHEGSVRADRPCDTGAGGCIIETTIDPRYQNLAERIVLENAEQIRTKYHAKNIALVAADRATGHILAYVGNVRFGDSETGSMIDMARVPRQPGSSFKPFVYATAFADGMNPGSFLLDGPLTIGTDHPRNYEGGYRGWTSISHALAASRNIPAIRALLYSGGEDAVLAMAARVGIVAPMAARQKMRQSDPQFSYGYPLAIGSAEVPLVEMVQGYATLANAGIFRPLSTIKSIRTVDGRPLDRKLFEAATQVMEPLYARWLTSILSDPSLRPTPAWNAALTVPGIQAAIKTGTSDHCIGIDFATGTCSIMLPGDVWTLGYTPEFVVGIWAGNADYASLTPDADGMNVTTPLWKEFVQAAHQLRPDGQTSFPPALIAGKGEGRR